MNSEGSQENCEGGKEGWFVGEEVGCGEGSEVVGKAVGSDVSGLSVGESEGMFVGSDEVGRSVGEDVTGESEGDSVGDEVGRSLGAGVGSDVVGAFVVTIMHPTFSLPSHTGSPPFAQSYC